MVYIKKVLIQGFKSYKDQTKLEEFDQGVNVVVGKNGAGKSNFFYAIRFVLSDMFTNLRSEERQLLLHEGSGDIAMSAYVEIHFDNSDNRFPIDREEVILRRSIGLKKDEYFLDNKHVTKHDVINLLESAGFSRSNPYYIVQQGKVTALTMMKDAERLDLLKEVAGTRVYDERKEESEKIMLDTDGKREKIRDTLNYIENRLSELETEKEELKKYQTLDRQQRALKYTIYDKELSSTTAGLEGIETERANESAKSNEVHQRALRMKEELRDVEKEIKGITTELMQLSKEKDFVEQEKQDLIKNRAKLELDVQDGAAKIERERGLEASLSTELTSLQRQIDDTTRDLADNVRPQFMKQFNEHNDLEEKLANCTRRINELYSKQGRSAQFKSKKERDAFLKNEIKQVEQQRSTKSEQIHAIEAEVEEARQLIEERESQVESLTKELTDRRTEGEQTNKQLEDLKERRDQQSNRRKEAWKQDSDVEINLQNAKNDLLKYERQLQSSVNKIISNGLSAVRRIAQENNIKGVYGPLIELFECSDEYMTAVEVTAGTSLFHIVVDTDETAARILELMNRDREGRVTFMPLNKLNAKPVDLPQSNDVMPMLNHLSFDGLFKKAFQQIFGKTLICRDIEVAAAFARNYNLDCITLDGDQVNRRGALTGGYYDVRFSRLECIKNIKKLRRELTGLSTTSTRMKEVLQKSDQEISHVLGEIQKLESSRNNLKDILDKISADSRSINQEIHSLREIVEQKELTLAGLRISLKQLEETKKALESEVGTDLLAKLSESEQRELLALNEQIEDLKKQLIASSEKRAELESNKTGLENLLSNNLAKRKEQITEELNRLNVREQVSELESTRRQLTSIQQTIERITGQLKELDGKVEAKEEQKRELNKNVDTLKARETKQKRELQQESENMEKLLNKRSLLLQKREECERKIREIGSLPTSEVENFKGQSLKQLLDKLREVKQDLKKYSSVNKKALDQFLQFTEQRDKLMERKTELDRGAEAIARFIDSLEKKKDEAIERTFKGVAKHFTEVFAELVPGGKAALIMQKKQAKAGAAPAAEEKSGRINQYTGIAIKVSFSKEGESSSMNQLSGGQKSVVSLALIFAIQRCDPAPFYLFDEIDSALDTTYRSAVARLIRKQSTRKDKDDKEERYVTQFIATTFRPELVQAAHKCYGITHQNKESKINVVEKEEALAIIQEEQGQQQVMADEEEEEQ